MNQAGENRVELKQVLNHYKTIEDKEKLRAAEYLIRNMPYHRAFIGDVEEYRQSLDSLLPEMSSVSRYNELMFGLNRQFIKKKNLMYDVENISSEFLIQNIEESFREGYTSCKDTFSPFNRNYGKYKASCRFFVLSDRMIGLFFAIFVGNKRFSI